MIRFFDIFLSLILLPFIILPLVVISILILVEDGSPIIFRQTRAGKDRKPFTIYKLRSMRAGNFEQIHGEVSGDSDQDKVLARQKFKTTEVNDQRITTVGKFIRKTHLDELPQLFNVLRGDMSLVGVRPDTPSQEVDYENGYWVERHRYTPGITGPAQVTTSEFTGISGRQKQEGLWLHQRSLLLYFSILFKTFFKVLKGNSF